MTATDFLDIARKATQLGAYILRNSHPANIRAKGDRDLVTDVDIGIQNTIADYLARATPTIDLLAEESAVKPSIATAEYLWVLDPIDGTSNFVHGLPLCAVSLALVHRGRSIVAVTHAPLLDRIYHAVTGNGAYLNDQPITTSATETLDAAIVSLGDYATGPGAPARNQQRLALTAGLIPNVERIRMFGAATLTSRSWPKAQPTPASSCPTSRGTRPPERSSPAKPAPTSATSPEPATPTDRPRQSP